MLYKFYFFQTLSQYYLEIEIITLILKIRFLYQSYFWCILLKLIPTIIGSCSTQNNRLDCIWKWQKLSLYQIGSSYRIFIKLYKLNSETQNMASKSKKNNLILVNICFHIFIAIMVVLALNTNENLEMRIFNVIMIVLPVVGSAIYLSKRLG